MPGAGRDHQIERSRGHLGVFEGRFPDLHGVELGQVVTGHRGQRRAGFEADDAQPAKRQRTGGDARSRADLEHPRTGRGLAEGQQIVEERVRITGSHLVVEVGDGVEAAGPILHRSDRTGRGPGRGDTRRAPGTAAVAADSRVRRWLPAPAAKRPQVSGIDPDRIPTHVAVVMDGNGRWAQRRGLKRTEGHAAGEEALFDTVEGALELGIKWLTVYAFSTENWKRPTDEVRYLMGFNESILTRRRDEMTAFQDRLHGQLSAGGNGIISGSVFAHRPYRPDDDLV